MGTLIGNTLLGQVAADLIDTANEHWTKSELLSFLNDGQREIVVLKPTANVVIESVELTPASARQSLPANGYAFLRAIRNMGSDGDTPGASLREVDGSAMDAFDPTWRETTNPSASVSGYFYNQDAPRKWHVVPIAPPAALFVEIEYSAAPADVTINGVDGGSSNSAISLDDAYAVALKEYVMYRAYARNAEVANHQALATAHYEKFVGLVKAKAGGE